MTDYMRIAPMVSWLQSPLAAVTCSWQGKRNAQIAVFTASASIVPERPRVIVQIYKRNYSHELIYQSNAFALNFLRKDQLHLIRDFGLVSGRKVDKLARTPYDVKASGSPILKDCWGYLDCHVINAMDGGDMTCFLAEVIDGDILVEGGPLWWREAKKVLPSEWLHEWEMKMEEEVAFSRQNIEKIDYSPWSP